MIIRIRNALPALVLVVAMAMPGYAETHSIASAAGPVPVTDAVLSRPQASLQRDMWRAPSVLLLDESNNTSGTLAPPPASANLTTRFSGVTKTYALALSVLGMMLSISLLRLGRSFPMRTAS